MKILDDVKLDFTDVLILPKRSGYSSRSEVCLERAISFKYSPCTWTGVPIMVSNMDTTGTIEMAKKIQEHKVLTCLHKYYIAKDLKTAELDPEYYAVSTGIGEKDLQNLDEIMSEIPVKFICIDVANGYMSKLIQVCQQIRLKYSNAILIAGNVCTSEGVMQLHHGRESRYCQGGYWKRELLHDSKTNRYRHAPTKCGNRVCGYGSRTRCPHYQ